MSAGGPIGAGIGAVFGAAGGILSAYNARKQQTRFRRRQRAAIKEAREFANQRVSEITGSELFSGAQEFLTSTFQDPMSSPLAEDFARGVRQAQAARGLLFGGAAVSQEASGLAAFSQDLRTRLLPQAMQFAQAPEQIRQSVLGFEAPIRVASRTGAALPGITPPQILDSPLSAAFKQAAAGAAGGYMIGSEISDEIDEPPEPPARPLPQGTPLEQEILRYRAGAPSSMELLRAMNRRFDPFAAGYGTPYEETAVGRLGGLG